MGLSALAAAPEPARNGVFFCAKTVLVTANSFYRNCRAPPTHCGHHGLDASRTARRRFVRGRPKEEGLLLQAGSRPKPTQVTCGRRGPVWRGARFASSG